MNRVIEKFLSDERGAITVDWVVLSAAAVGMSIAATGVVRGGLDDLASNLEAQLRSQQISDAFVQFRSNQFDMAYDMGLMTEEQAQDLFEQANLLTNADILGGLEDAIEKIVNGTISDSELQEAFALASVAYQRNIIDDDVIHYYFGDNDGNYGGNEGAARGDTTTTVNSDT